ncbi:MAG TPA: NAD(P)H-hydrate dehydratase [Lysobacter sp.]
MRDLSPLFATDSVRRFEAGAIASAADGAALMERAGQAAWRRALELWPAATRLLVICGAGGNGGDGFVFARLAHESGRAVTVVEHAPRGIHHAAAAASRARFVDAGGRVEPWCGTLPEAEVVVDALLGIGLSAEPRNDAAAAIAAINAHGAPVLALDVPSGVDARGIAGDAVRAWATIEFLLPKAVLRSGPALERAGRLTCATLDVAGVGYPAPDAWQADASSLARWLPPRRVDTHKGEQGRVACVGGDAGSAGAILLCAEAAARTGAGLVRVHTRDAHHAALLARRPELMATPECEGVDVDWPDAIVVGPGLGQGNWGFAHLHRVLEADTPCVLDADALTIVARHGLALPARTVLTPHPGEAARLLGIATADVQRDRFGAAAAIAERYRATVVLKGAGTLVCAPGHAPVVLDAGNPGMATGGMGDVLAGTIAALLGQDMAPFDAACAGALLHSAAGDAAAAEGQRGLLAADLMPHLRRLTNPA